MMRKRWIGILLAATTLVMGAAWGESDFELRARAISIQDQEVEAQLLLSDTHEGMILCNPVMRALRGECAELTLTGGGGPSLRCTVAPDLVSNECVCTLTLCKGDTTLFSESIVVAIEP